MKPGGGLTGAPDGAVRKNLFIISPNNSGSNILRTVLAKSKKTWNLKREGQHTDGFHGPSSRGTGARLIWASDQKWLDLFCDSAAYDWSQSRQAWYEQAVANSREASIFVTSSPPFLLNVPALLEAFENSYFLFMVRNPYAAIEGICRRAKEQIIPDGEDIRILAARHIVTCFEYQKTNIEAQIERGTFFSYETLCHSPESVNDQISVLIPKLDDLEFGAKIPVKGMYNEPLSDMNAQQISKLSGDDIGVINTVLARHEPLLAHFGYDLLS